LKSPERCLHMAWYHQIILVYYEHIPEVEKLKSYRHCQYPHLNRSRNIGTFLK
jgi:hypothetical protein